MKTEKNVFSLAFLLSLSVLSANAGLGSNDGQLARQERLPKQDLVEHVKDYLESPPNYERLIVGERNPDDLEPGKYYFLRNQPGEMLFKKAKTLEALLKDADIVKGQSVSGQTGDLWWHSIERKEIQMWIDDNSPSEGYNRIELACETDFRAGLQILLLGINDAALDRSVIGSIQWNGDEFQFSVKLAHRERPAHFSVRIAAAEKDGIVNLFVRKRVENWRGAGVPKEFNYRYELDFRDGGDRWGYPRRNTRWFIPPGEPERIMNVFETVAAIEAESQMASDLFRPDASLLASARVYYLIDSELVYQSGDEWRKVRAADDPRGIFPEEAPDNRLWYFGIAAALLVPGAILLKLYRGGPK